MGFVKINTLNVVKVKLTERGMEQFVSNYNELTPTDLNISLDGFKLDTDELGYHTISMNLVLKCLGGVNINELIYPSIYINEMDLEFDKDRSDNEIIKLVFPD